MGDPHVSALVTILSGAAGLLRQLLTQQIGALEKWGEFAASHPRAAGEVLLTIAHQLEARGNSFKRRNGWRARRHHELARSLRQHAFELFERAAGLESTADICRKPGT